MIITTAALFLSHLEFENRVRIIGARLADAAERKTYEELKSRA